MKTRIRIGHASALLCLAWIACLCACGDKGTGPGSKADSERKVVISNQDTVPLILRIRNTDTVDAWGANPLLLLDTLPVGGKSDTAVFAAGVLYSIQFSWYTSFRDSSLPYPQQMYHGFMIFRIYKGDGKSAVNLIFREGDVKEELPDTLASFTAPQELP